MFESLGFRKFEKLIGLNFSHLEYSPFEPLEDICGHYKEQGKKIVIYGAGSAGKKVWSYLKEKGFEIDYFCDSDPTKQGKFSKDKKIISPETLSSNNTFVVIASSWEKEIAAYLKKKDIKYASGFIELFHDLWDNSYSILRKHVPDLLLFYNILSDKDSKDTLIGVLKYLIKRDPLELKKSSYKQYFHPFINFKKITNIIDAGAYPGDFSDEISEINSNTRCYLFEPDPENYKFLENKYKDKVNIESINKALFDSKTKVAFSCGIGMGSHVDFVGNRNIASLVEVETAFIDDFVAVNNIGNDSLYIKMDIEGAEYNALKGAKKTIKDFKPKLAVCLYHKPEHLFYIPLYIKELNKDYRLYLGYHENHDIVLYAL